MSVLKKIIILEWIVAVLLIIAIFFFSTLKVALVLSIIITFLTVFLSFASISIVPIVLNVADFKKNDWKVKIHKDRNKKENEYDVIIAGAGIGGLTCGALLSKKGYKVAVFEHQYHVGGYCSSFNRKGFTFNTGVEDVSGLGENGPVKALLKELGIEKEELFVRNTTKYYYKDMILDIPLEIEGLIKLLSNLFPNEKEKIDLFFLDAKEAYKECYSDVSSYGIIFPEELVAKVFGIGKLFSYPIKYKHFYDWTQKTYMQKLDEYFNNDDLKKILCALLVYMGTEPEKTQAINALAACVTFLINGGYSIKGGAQKFSEKLMSFIENNGGKVFLSNAVEKILVENNCVQGIKAKNGVYLSPIVVSNIDAKSTFNKLVDSQHLGKSFLQNINNLKMSTSFFLLYLGVNMDLSEYPILLKNIHEGWEVTINSNADKNMAPLGMASITILLDKDINYEEFPSRDSKEYLKLKKEISEKLLDKVEKYIPDLKKNIIFMEAATPKTFERYNLMPEGAVYSFDQSIDTKRPFYKTPVNGLYLVGASVFPGAGVEPVIVSGRICTNDICNWDLE